MRAGAPKVKSCITGSTSNVREGGGREGGREEGGRGISQSQELDSRKVRRREEGEEEVEVEEEEGETTPAASCMVRQDRGRELTRRGGWKRGGGWRKACCGLVLKLWKMVGKRKVRAGVEGVSSSQKAGKGRVERNGC